MRGKCRLFGAVVRLLRQRRLAAGVPAGLRLLVTVEATTRRRASYWIGLSPSSSKCRFLPRRPRTVGALAGGPALVENPHYRRFTPVLVMPYSSSWPALFAAEADRLAAKLAPSLVGNIEYIGSTAVPGLSAKPILDMLAPVEDLDAARAALPGLVDLGYRHAERRRRCGSTSSRARTTARGRTNCTSPGPTARYGASASPSVTPCARISHCSPSTRASS